eukprot:TRINITY_DN2914_c0_g1_i2.p1 TRINITY_DN2914_c0_g1~~TRINITY_DN2914_c0_g1_i2.p1  ORF type:complete len:835 (-),score=112.63 TRINITY_DN2914_c0_g1_i2:278-2782(-)
MGDARRFHWTYRSLLTPHHFATWLLLAESAAGVLSVQSLDSNASAGNLAAVKLVMSSNYSAHRARSRRARSASRGRHLALAVDREGRWRLPCEGRMPKIGEIVYSKGGRMIAQSLKGERGAWRLADGDPATVVEVDKDGDFRLKNPSGEESLWQFRANYVFKELKVKNKKNRWPGVLAGKKVRASWARALRNNIRQASFPSVPASHGTVIKAASGSTTHGELQLDPESVALPETVVAMPEAEGSADTNPAVSTMVSPATNSSAPAVLAATNASAKAPTTRGSQSTSVVATPVSKLGHFTVEVTPASAALVALDDITAVTATKSAVSTAAVDVTTSSLGQTTATPNTAVSSATEATVESTTSLSGAVAASVPEEAGTEALVTSTVGALPNIYHSPIAAQEPTPNKATTAVPEGAGTQTLSTVTVGAPPNGGLGQKTTQEAAPDKATTAMPEGPGTQAISTVTVGAPPNSGLGQKATQQAAPDKALATSAAGAPPNSGLGPTATQELTPEKALVAPTAGLPSNSGLGPTATQELTPDKIPPHLLTLTRPQCAAWILAGAAMGNFILLVTVWLPWWCGAQTVLHTTPSSLGEPQAGAGAGLTTPESGGRVHKLRANYEAASSGRVDKLRASYEAEVKRRLDPYHAPPEDEPVVLPERACGGGAVVTSAIIAAVPPNPLWATVPLVVVSGYNSGRSLLHGAVGGREAAHHLTFGVDVGIFGGALFWMVYGACYGGFDSMESWRRWGPVLLMFVGSLMISWHSLRLVLLEHQVGLAELTEADRRLWERAKGTWDKEAGQYAPTSGLVCIFLSVCWFSRIVEAAWSSLCTWVGSRQSSQC